MVLFVFLGGVIGSSNNADSQNQKAQQQIQQNTGQSLAQLQAWLAANPFPLSAGKPMTPPQQMGGTFGGGTFGGPTGGMIRPPQGPPVGTPGINPAAPRMTQPVAQQPAPPPPMQGPGQPPAPPNPMMNKAAQNNGGAMPIGLMALLAGLTHRQGQ